MGKKSTRKRGGEPSDETGVPNDTKTEKDKCNATPGMEYVIDKKGNRHCIPKCPADRARKLEGDGALDCLNKEQCEAQGRDFLTVKKKDFCLPKCPQGLVRDYGSTKCLTEEDRDQKQKQAAENQKRGALSRKKQPENAAEASAEEGKKRERVTVDSTSSPYTEPSPGTRKRAKEKAKARFKSHFGSVHKDFNREIEYDGLTNDQREKKSQEGKHRENATANKISPPDGLTKEERARKRRATRKEKLRSSKMYVTIEKERAAKQAALIEERTKADRELEEECAKEGTLVIQLGNKKKVCAPKCAEDETVKIGFDKAECINEANEKEAKQNKALEKKRIECAKKGLDAVTHNGKNMCVPVCKDGEKLHFTGSKAECLTEKQIEQRDADERRKHALQVDRAANIEAKNKADLLAEEKRAEEKKKKDLELWTGIFQTKAVNLKKDTKSTDAKEVQAQIEKIERKIEELKGNEGLRREMEGDATGKLFKDFFFDDYRFNKDDKENLCLSKDRKLNTNQLSVYTITRLRAEDIFLSTSGLLVNHGTGAGKTLIGVLIMLAFWNKLHGGDKFWCCMSISTKKNQEEDNDIKKLAQLIVEYFPFYKVFYRREDGKLEKNAWFSKDAYLQQIDLTQDEHKFDKEQPAPEFIVNKFGPDEAPKKWKKVCLFKDHWRWVQLLLGDRIFAGISDSLVPRVKDLPEGTIPEVEQRVKAFWNNRENGGILLFTNSLFGRDFEPNLWPSDADALNKQRVVKKQSMKTKFDAKLEYIEQIVQGFFNNTQILDPIGPDLSINSLLRARMKDNALMLKNREEVLQGKPLQQHQNDLQTAYFAEGQKSIDEYTKKLEEGKSAKLPKAPVNQHIDITDTPLHRYISEIVGQFNNFGENPQQSLKFDRTDPIGFVYKELNKHEPYFTKHLVILQLIDYFHYYLRSFYSIEPVEMTDEPYQLYPTTDDGRINIAMDKKSHLPKKLILVNVPRMYKEPVYQVAVQTGAIDHLNKQIDEDVVDEKDKTVIVDGTKRKEDEEEDLFLKASAGKPKEEMTKDDKERVMEIMQTPYFRLNEKRQMEHCVFILDEMQFLFAPPAKEMQYKAYYERTLYALQFYRNIQNTYVVGLTATPGFTTGDVRSILSIIKGAPDKWITGEPSKKMVEELQETDIGLASNVFYYNRTPGVIRGEKYYDRPIKINGDWAYKTRETKSDSVDELVKDINSLLGNQVSVADFSADKRYYPDLKIEVVCVPLTPSYSEQVNERKLNLESNAKMVLDRSVKKQDSQIRAFRELHANAPIYIVAGEYYLTESEANKSAGNPEFVTKFELPITEYKKTLRQDMLYIREASESVDVQEEESSGSSSSASTGNIPVAPETKVLAEPSGTDMSVQPVVADPTLQPGATEVVTTAQPEEGRVLRDRDALKLKKEENEAKDRAKIAVGSDDSSSPPIYEPEFTYLPFKTSQSNGFPKLIQPGTKLMAVIDNLLTGVAHNNGKHYVYCSDAYALFVIAHYLRTISHRSVSLEKVEGEAKRLQPAKEVKVKDKEAEILRGASADMEQPLVVTDAETDALAPAISVGGAKAKKAKGNKNKKSKPKPKPGKLNLMEFEIEPDDPADQDDPYKYKRASPKLIPYRGESVNELVHDFEDQNVLRFYYMQGKTTALSPYQKSIPSELVSATKRGREIVSGMHTYENINKEANIKFDGEYPEALKKKMVNLEGDLIPIILATGEAYKGVDFRGIQHIHVVDPFVDINDLVQLMGRGPRTCSHALFAEKDRKVTLHIYMGNHTPQQGMTKPPRTVDWDIYWDSVDNFNKVWMPIYAALRNVSYDKEVFRSLLEESVHRVDILLSLKRACDNTRQIKNTKVDPYRRAFQLVNLQIKKKPVSLKPKIVKKDTDLTLAEVYDLKFKINAILLAFKEKNKGIPKLFENMYRSFNVVKDPETPSIAIVTVRWSDNTVTFPLKYLINNENCRKIKKYFSSLLLAVTYIQASDNDFIPKRTEAENKLAEQTAINISSRHPKHKTTKKKTIVPDADVVPDVPESKNENDGSSASTADTEETKTDAESESTEGEEGPTEAPEEAPAKAKSKPQCPAKEYPLPSQKDFCNASEIEREVLTRDLESKYSDEANPNGKIKNKDCLETAATKRKQLETLQKSCVKHYTKSKSRLCVEKPVEDLEGGGKRKRSRKCRSKPLTRKKRAKKAKAGWWFWK